MGLSAEATTAYTAWNAGHAKQTLKNLEYDRYPPSLKCFLLLSRVSIRDLLLTLPHEFPAEMPASADACPVDSNASAGTMAPLGDDGIQLPLCVERLWHGPLAYGYALAFS